MPNGSALFQRPRLTRNGLLECETKEAPRLTSSLGRHQPPFSPAALLLSFCLLLTALSEPGLVASQSCTRRTLPLLARAAALVSRTLADRAAAIADKCAGTHAPENTTCDASALCDTSVLMATRFVCIADAWR